MQNLEKSHVKVTVYIAVSEYSVNCAEAHKTQIEKVFMTYDKAAAYIKQREDFMYEVHKHDQIARKLRDCIPDILMACHYVKTNYMMDRIKQFGIKPEDHINEKTFDRYDRNWETDINVMKEVYNRFKYLLLKIEPELPELSDKDFPYIYECCNNDDFRNYGEYSIWEEEMKIE